MTEWLAIACDVAAIFLSGLTVGYAVAVDRTARPKRKR